MHENGTVNVGNIDREDVEVAKDATTQSFEHFCPKEGEMHHIGDQVIETFLRKT